MEPQTIQVRVNGEPRQVPAGCSVSQLLERLGVPTSGTAVELEGSIVSGTRLETIRLRQGQTLEVVRLVGGG